MKLRLCRIALKDTYTIGKLEVFHWGEWKWVADTIEDKVRDLNKNGVFDNGEKKVYGETSIPYGIYKIRMDIKSPKFANRVWALKYNGIVPRLEGVNHFEGVLIHPLNNASQSLGCIGVGKYVGNGTIMQSMATYYELMDNWLIPSSRGDGEDITLEII